MWDFLTRLFQKPQEDVWLEVPTMDIKFNHRLKIAVLFTYDTNARAEDYIAIENHLAKRGYLLQIVVASANTLRPGA